MSLARRDGGAAAARRAAPFCLPDSGTRNPRCRSLAGVGLGEGSRRRRAIGMPRGEALANHGENQYAKGSPACNSPRREASCPAEECTAASVMSLKQVEHGRWRASGHRGVCPREPCLSNGLAGPQARVPLR